MDDNRYTEREARIAVAAINVQGDVGVEAGAAFKACALSVILARVKFR